MLKYLNIHRSGLSGKVLQGCFLLISAVAVAQQPEHEFSVYGAGGLSTLRYTPSTGVRSEGTGGLLGIGYTWYYYKNWGVVTGIELSQFSARTENITLEDRYKAIDADGASFEFRSKVVNNSENQTVVMLQIPFLLQYENMFGKNYGWYCMGGTKVCFPLKSAYRVSSSLTTSGYYEKEQWTYEEQTFAGFGRFSGNGDGKLHFKIVVLASIETGMKWRLEEGLFLYGGIYCDYGVDNMLRNRKSNRLVEYDIHRLAEYNAGRSEAFRPNSILTAKYANDNRLVYITEKATLLSAGVKLKITFGLGKANGAKRWKPGWKPTRR
ncbi:MAG: hypothetical protein LBF89_12280 [Bacteroidales bacterium]|jgi:hypothetical protein|nr:hypothetical protein [Bacteroidales bacterium]